MKLATIVIAVAVAGFGGASVFTQTARPASSHSQNLDSQLATWKAKPRELAQTLIKKYGPPNEVTATRVIWHNNGPWKFTELVNEEIPHQFPVPHADMLFQAVNYRIDPSKADEVLSYDGSVILERTKGEIAARCDKEEPNFLAVNLAHEVASGTRSVDDARKFYAQTMMAFMKEGKSSDYLTGFRFEVAKSGTGDPDKPFGGLVVPAGGRQ